MCIATSVCVWLAMPVYSLCYMQVANHISCMIAIANGTILSQPQLLLIYASEAPALPLLPSSVSLWTACSTHAQGIHEGICTAS